MEAEKQEDNVIELDSYRELADLREFIGNVLDEIDIPNEVALSVCSSVMYIAGELELIINYNNMIYTEYDLACNGYDLLKTFPKYGLFVRTITNEVIINIYSNNKREILAEAKSYIKSMKQFPDEGIAYIEVVCSGEPDYAWMGDTLLDHEFNETLPQY